MPLDIMPAPAAVPGAAPPPGQATDAPPGGMPLTGSAALLFGLLLAQTVGQNGSKAPSAASVPNAVAGTPHAVTVTGKGEDKKKAKDAPAAEAQPTPGLTPSTPWMPPAPLPTQAANPPKPDAAGNGHTKDRRFLEKRWTPFRPPAVSCFPLRQTASPRKWTSSPRRRVARSCRTSPCPRRHPRRR